MPAFLLAQVSSLHTKAELVSSVEQVQPGQEFWLALRLESQPHWHTYWVNPGEAGFASTLDWQERPEGITVAEGFAWPSPIYYLQDGIISYVYEGEVFLLLRARAASDLKPEQELVFKARADWLECDDKGCWPGGADVALTLRSAATGSVAAPSQWAQPIQTTAENLPRALPQEWQASAHKAGANTYQLVLKPVGDGSDMIAAPAETANLNVKPVYFFPLTDAITAAEPKAQQMTRHADGTITVLLQSADGSAALQSIAGVFTAANGWLANGKVPALEINVPVTAGDVLTAGGAAGSGVEAVLTLRLLGLAFVGGLILNLMPCVFPVLGIKVLGFVQQAGSERRKVVLHGLAFTAGVLISFWVLSGVLIALRMGGAGLGWGFQLQSPEFVAGLSVLLLIFGLSLSGVFDIGYGAMSVGSNLAAKSGLQGSFFSGVLATVVATPCAAPFLAPALGAALTLPAISSLTVFTAIALGLSAPYLILSAFPALIGLLPRPGAWMETFKQFMAFLLYATVAYLIWSLAGQVGEDWLLNILLGLVAISAGCWAYGRWLKPGSSKRVRGWVWTIIFAALGGWLIFTPVRPLEWEDWSPERVAELQAQGRPIYVDFTARWCVTCRVNKRAVFGSEKVLEQFKKDKVAMLKADWTDRNEMISKELAKYGRSAVPFNLFYGSRGNPTATEPLVLPELLTPSIVLDALQTVTTQPDKK